MLGRKVVGVLVAATPLAYLVGLNVGQLGRLGSDVALAPLGAGEAWLKAGLHLLAFLVVPLVGFWIAAGSGGVASWYRRVRVGSWDRTTALRTTGIVSILLLATVLAAATTASHRHGLFSLETSRAAFASLPFHSALALSFAAALSEEVLFRGIMLRGLMRRTAPAVAIGSQAVVFGAIHLAYGSVVHAAMATVFGVVLAMFALRAGLAASVLLHLEVNLVLLAVWSDVQGVLGVTLLVLSVGVGLLAWSTRSRGPVGAATEPAPVAS